MKQFLSFLFLVGAAITVGAQDSVRYRIIFIGDAGEKNAIQQAVIEQAAGKILSGKTSVVYLGDNIYPRGIGLPGSKEEASTQAILKAQYQPMRQKAAPVYFIPGNHDWDKSGPLGLEKIRAQTGFLQIQNDTLLQMTPANGCPDPVEILLSPMLALITWDSEWWLYPGNKNNADADCVCKTKNDVLARLEELKKKNKDKIILLASHHPFTSYGQHGGHYTLKEHLFPLTAISKNLYIPLPVIGSLYPFLRKTIGHPEDLGHPLYKDMISSVSKVFDSFPNMAYVAGHEHGLQLINDTRLQIVSGSGAKSTVPKNGKGSLFRTAAQGFVTADLLLNNTMRFSFYTAAEMGNVPAFTYNMPFVNVLDGLTAPVMPVTADSVTINIRPDYDRKGPFHRFVFGENYRKEWAAPIRVPVIKLSQVHGGLMPLQLGGGMQSKSLRLADSTGKEWVVRSVEKSVDALLPQDLRRTFAKDLLDDVTSAQHPYAALAVPPIANAVQVPHSNPVIGLLSPDKNLGIYSSAFNNMIVLLEEREPLGESDNTEKLLKNLQKDHDNNIDGKAFLKARILDAFLGDWDRHEDQWRWFDSDKGKEKMYTGVPRDRDQVFHLTQGILPKLAAQPGLIPYLRNFDDKMRRMKWLLFKTKFVHSYPGFQLSRDEWQKQATDFSAAVSDSVLEAAIRRLPKPAYDLRHDELLKKLKSRRQVLPQVIDKYYAFTQKIVDIQASNKNEFVEITGTDNGNLTISLNKINKNGEVKDLLMNKTYDASLTKEVRLYVGNGKDSIVFNNKTSDIKLRIIGGNDTKTYQVLHAKNTIQLYDKKNSSVFLGDSMRIKRTINNDTSNTAFVPVDLYNVLLQNFILGLNRDDGFIFGSGFTYIRQEGFRKQPYTSKHYFYGAHSFSTSAYRFGYKGEWRRAFNNADLVANILAKAPDNTTNFFGRGNETVIDKKGDYTTFYRTRYSIYQADLGIRNKINTGLLTIGPSLYYYLFNAGENAGRFINSVSAVGSYDSATVNNDKLHLGITAQYTNDKRNSKIIPQWGSYVNIRMQAYKGISTYAASFAQLIPEIAIYKSLDANSNIVLAERVGGAITIGKAAFYQSAFIGGHENLLGYRQYRFAGKHSFYNNLELRIKIADLANYILPGQFGITGFWDIGRVWENDDNSGKWHNGTGAGIYFAPASLLAFNFVMGHSSEGWLPYFTMGFRF